MSVFRVKLNNASQGLLDTDINGVQNETSIQRTIYVTGPNRINRKLVDGEEFTDCNYWKRFTEDEMGAESAFIEVVTDDGSVYSDKVALATNVFKSLIKRARKYVVPVYDFQLVTEPLTPEQWKAIGWSGKEGLSEAGNQFHYYQIGRAHV